MSRACSRGTRAHRGLLLENEADTGAARGVSERLLGLVGEVVGPNTVNEEHSGYSEKASLSAGADTKANTRGGGALERGHRASLERLAQLGNALSGVGAVAPSIEAAELVVGQTVSTGMSVNGR